MAHASTMSATASPTAVRSEKLPPWLIYGILFGLLGAASIVLWGPIGVSGTYPRFIGALFRALNPAYAEGNPYLVKMGSLLKPETFLVVGLLIGGFLGARVNKEKTPVLEMVHTGEVTTSNRYRDAFIGGFLIVFGARLAGGCTSGHIISGITQLSVSGFIFAIGTFATGIMTAKMLNGRRAAGA